MFMCSRYIGRREEVLLSYLGTVPSRCSDVIEGRSFTLSLSHEPDCHSRVNQNLEVLQKKKTALKKTACEMRWYTIHTREMFLL